MKNMTSAPAKEKVDVSIQLATRKTATLWDNEIRPVLIEKYPGRTEFNWRNILIYYPLLCRSAFSFKAKAYALAIYTPDAQGMSVLSGMTMLVEGVHFPGGMGKCVYVWFLQSAPDAYILSKGARLTPRSGEVLLDAALIASLAAGYDGRILLHADATGGQDLLDYYTHFGLISLPVHIPLSITSKKNDGRYFFADAATANFLIKRFNRYRNQVT